jgi:hypothetical protein
MKLFCIRSGGDQDGISGRGSFQDDLNRGEITSWRAFGADGDGVTFGDHTFGDHAEDYDAFGSDDCGQAANEEQCGQERK